jgi:arylsulfatase A-like enzyme
MNGERALVDKGAYAHPKVARVPLWVHLPGGKESGRVVEEAVSLLDVAPTILEMTGVQPAARMDGESLLPFVTGEGQGRHEDFIFEAGWHLAPNPAVAMQHRFPDGQHFLYVFNLADDADELYDLAGTLGASDRTKVAASGTGTPYVNVAADGRYAGVRREMIRRLGAFLCGDPRWRCYWHPFRIEFEGVLGASAGDQQMFRPERDG